jgi:orotidine-5'-phosphate decarboxylase
MGLPLIYVAIDTPDLNAAKAMAQMVVPVGCGIKLGLEFFNAFGPQGVEAIQKEQPEASLFIDLKYHDIPNTVAGAVRSIARLAPDFLNVHASGGLEMMRAARDALCDEAEKRQIKPAKLLAVTVLTTMDEDAVAQVGWLPPVENQVKRLAILTQAAGLDGVVCSPLEVAAVREVCGNGFITMVPGIRFVSGNDDQKRTMTPLQAMEAGVNHMVIGRPITQAVDPAKAAAEIIASL